MISILFITFFLLAIIAFMPFQNGKTEKVLYFFICLYLISLAAFRPEDVDRDHKNYIDMFEGNNIELVEPGFLVITEFVKIFSNNHIYLFICFAILGVSIKFTAIKQLTKLWFLSILIYVSNFYMLHEFTQIRAGIASAILLLCVKPIYDRNWKKFLFFALPACTIHFSAILIFLLWFLNNKPQKKLLAFLIPVGYAIYFLKINLILIIPIPSIQEKIEVYQQLQELGDEQWTSINVFNMLFLVKIFIFYFILWKFDLIYKHNKYLPLLMKIYCISLVSFPIFATMPVLGFRINEFFGIIEVVLFPLIYYTIQPAQFSRLIIIIIALCLFSIVIFYNNLLLY